jgi:hypothetical protein
MPETYASNLGNIFIPQANENDYVTGATSLRQTLINILDNAYSSGNTVPTAGIQDNAVTTAKINDGAVTSAKLASGITVGVIANDTTLDWRNAANSADVGVMKLNTSDQLQIDSQISRLRLINDTYITARNNADSAYIDIIKIDTSDDIAFGAEIGSAKMKNNTYFTGRNNADNADINGWKVNASDEFEIGANTVIPGQLDLNIGASGDPKIVFDINGTDEWHIGVDDTDGDALKIGTGAAVGTNTALEISEAGIVSQPLRCAFSANLSGDVSNVTGNGTEYTVAFDTEDYDLNSDFNTSTGIFTAPEDGYYFFGSRVGLNNMDGNVSRVKVEIQFGVGTTDQLVYEEDYVTTITDSFDRRTYEVNGVIQLSANDTAKVDVTVSGMAGDTVDVEGSDLSYTTFYGWKIA